MLHPTENRNSPKTCLPLSTSSWLETLKREREKTEARTKLKQQASNVKRGKQNKSPIRDLKVHKVRVYPTKEQATLLKIWLGACRWTYNRCAASVNSKECAANRKELRSKHVNNSNFVSNSPSAPMDLSWVSEVPYDIRDEAMNDVVKAVAAYNAKKKENQTGFHLKFRSRRDSQQSLVVLKKHWNHAKGVYSSCFASDKLLTYRASSKPKRVLPTTLDGDSRLILDRYGRWWFCMPEQVKQEESVVDRGVAGKIVALDPGVRTFLTTYDNEGSVNEWGINDRTRLFRLGVYADKLASKIRKTPKRRAKSMRKALSRLYDRIRHLVDDVHHKSIRWLLSNYETVLIPKFESQDMCKREGRRIHVKTVRGMLHWSHYRFRHRLLIKSREYPGSRVFEVDEAYTSKTCRCGQLNHALGSSKLFQCPVCGWCCDRDVVGSRNVLIKYMSSPSGECLVPSPSISDTGSASTTISTQTSG